MSSPWIKAMMTQCIWKDGGKTKNSLSNSQPKEIKGHKKTFTVYMGDELMDTEVGDLRLSVRSYNCLKRAGFNKVGDIIGSIESEDDLMRIRNCGKTSADEILEQIFIYQNSLLDAEPKVRRVIVRDNPAYTDEDFVFGDIGREVVLW